MSAILYFKDGTNSGSAYPTVSVVSIDPASNGLLLKLTDSANNNFGGAPVASVDYFVLGPNS